MSDDQNEAATIELTNFSPSEIRDFRSIFLAQDEDRSGALFFMTANARARRGRDRPSPSARETSSRARALSLSSAPRARARARVRR